MALVGNLYVNNADALEVAMMNPNDGVATMANGAKCYAREGHLRVLITSSQHQRINSYDLVANTTRCFSENNQESMYMTHIHDCNLQQRSKVLIHETDLPSLKLTDAGKYGRVILNHNEVVALQASKEENPPDADAVIRMHKLHDTLHTLRHGSERNKLRDQAQNNLKDWKTHPQNPKSIDLSKKFHVIKGDWGDVAQMFTKATGETFAVLNMANAEIAGGGYIEGMPAQEENMFLRTDAHFWVDAGEFDQAADRYTKDKTNLINGHEGRVYLDNTEGHERIVIRGPENRDAPDLGYEPLSNLEIFPIYELRSAAKDYRGGDPFQLRDLQNRVRAQLETLREKKQKHVILSAFGCGAFRNPAEDVARVYRQEIDTLKSNGFEFDYIVFAIFYPGYGNDNYPFFENEFSSAEPATPTRQEIPDERRIRRIAIETHDPQQSTLQLTANQVDGQHEVVLWKNATGEGENYRKVANGTHVSTVGGEINKDNGMIEVEYDGRRYFARYYNFTFVPARPLAILAPETPARKTGLLAFIRRFSCVSSGTVRVHE